MFLVNKQKGVLTLALSLMAITASAFYLSQDKSILPISESSKSLSANNRVPTKSSGPAKTTLAAPEKLALGGTVLAEDSGVIVDVDSDRGWFDIQFNDLPAFTDSRLPVPGSGNISRCRCCFASGNLGEHQLGFVSQPFTDPVQFGTSGEIASRIRPSHGQQPAW